MIVGYAFSIFIIVFGIYSSYDHYVKSKKSGYLSTMGEIIDYRVREKWESNDGPGGGRNWIYYSPIILYKVNEKQYELKGVWASTSKPKVGKKVLIKYNPNKPEESILSKNFFGITTIIIGGLLLMLMIILSLH